MFVTQALRVLAVAQVFAGSEGYRPQCCGLQLGEIGVELLTGPVCWGRSIGGNLACAAYTICLVYLTCYPVLPPQELLPFNRCAAAAPQHALDAVCTLRLMHALCLQTARACIWHCS